jgi:hypothetical protein
MPTSPWRERKRKEEKGRERKRNEKKTREKTSQ